MLRNTHPVKINDEDFDILVNVGSMIDLENQTSKGFMALAKEAETGSAVALAQLLSVCLTKNGKPVGIDFVRAMEFATFGDLFMPLIDAIIDAFPKDKKNEVNQETKK